MIEQLCCPAAIGLAVFVLGTIAAWMLVRTGALSDKRKERQNE